MIQAPGSVLINDKASLHKPQALLSDSRSQGIFVV
jgi:hypothetical protein